MKVRMDYNVIDLLSVSFACNDRIYRDIDLIYKKKPGYYNHLAIQSEYIDTSMMNSFNIIQMTYYIRAIGIILDNIEETDDERGFSLNVQITSIAKKGWKKLNRFIFNSSKPIQMSEIDQYVPIETSNPDTDLILRFQMTLFFHLLYNKTLDHTDKMTQKYMLFYSSITNQDFTEQLETNQYDDTFKNAVKVHYSFIKGKISFDNILNDLDNKELNLLRELGGMPFTLENLSPTSIYLENKLSKAQVEKMIVGYLLITKEYELNETKFLPYMMYARMIGAMSIAYKKYTEMILNNHYQLDESYTEYEKMQQELYEKNCEIDKKDRQIEALHKQLIDLQVLLQEEENKNRKLKIQIEENENNHNELVALRQLMLSIRGEEIIPQEEKRNDVTNNPYGIIIGGHPQFNIKLKKLAPYFKYIAPDQLNFDTDIITKDSIVFFITGYLSHSLYYKCINVARERQAKIAFLNQSNIDLTMKEILEVLGESI